MAENFSDSVSIVIPAYAEEKRIGRAVEELTAYAREFPRLSEVLIIVEPSGDDTAGEARRKADGSSLIAVLERSGHSGKGSAVREGMLLAGGEIIFFMDADLSVPLDGVAEFVSYLEGHPEVDIAIGSRRHPQSRITQHQHILREQSGRMFNRAVRWLGLSRSKDTQCGFKAFRRKAARDVFSRAQLDGFAFDVEALFIAEKLGYRVDELPVRWHNDAHTKFSAWRDGWRSFRDLLRIRRYAEMMAPIGRAK